MYRNPFTRPLSTLDDSDEPTTLHRGIPDGPQREMAEREVSKAHTTRTGWWVAIAVIIIGMVYRLFHDPFGLSILEWGGLIILVVVSFFNIRSLNARIAELEKATSQSS